MSFTVRVYLLALLLAFQSANAIASCNDWRTLKPNSKKETFILAMGANTGNLKMANHDAKSFAKAMQKRFRVPGSHVCIRKYVKRWQFEYALERLAKFVRKQDQVFIFFSGHGTKQRDNSGDEKDCCDEALVTLDSPVTDDAFVSWVKKLKTNRIITFIDTCFASGMLRGEKNCQKAKSKFLLKGDAINCLKRCRPRGFKQPLKGVLYAASKEHQDAWETSEGGLFTFTFIKNLKAYPKESLDKIFRRTKQQVSAATRKKGCVHPQDPQRW